MSLFPTSEDRAYSRGVHHGRHAVYQELEEKFNQMAAELAASREREARLRQTMKDAWQDASWILNPSSDLDVCRKIGQRIMGILDAALKIAPKEAE